MSNSSFLDNPLLKVSRPVAACSRCRTAKIKCDGKLPACSACEKAGKASTCSGASDEFAKGKERSYVASLEGYCEKLERRISNLRRRQMAVLTEGAGVVRENSITSVSSPGSVSQSLKREVSDIDDLVGDFGFLSVNATSRDFHGVTSSTSFANLLMSVSVVKSLPSRSSEPLPPRHEATPLLQYYFDHIFTQLPFFVETNFWTSVDAVYQANGRFAKPFDHWILRLVLATASASISYQHGDKSYRRALSLVVGAMQYAEDVLHPGSIMGIQAILLLAQYSLFDPRHFHSWYLVGMAVRVMVDLGLHHDLPSEVMTDASRLDIRRRVFHIIYSLDRCVSSVLGRTFSFSDNSVNVALPTSTASTSLGASVTKQSHVFLRSIKPALHLVKIRQILSSGYQDMYYNGREPHFQPLVPIWSLCARIQEWYENCPTDVPNYFTTVYRLEMLYTTIIILSPSHRYPELCDFHKALLLDRCMDYADQLHQALDDPSVLPSITFIDIQRVYQVGQRFVELLKQDYDLLLSPLIPVPPPVSQGTPDPPPLRNEDRINCHARSVRCLSHIRGMLQYCSRKWDMNTLLEQFDQASATIQKRLMQTPMMYFNGPGTYLTGPSATLPPAGSTYAPFDMGQFNP